MSTATLSPHNMEYLTVHDLVWINNVVVGSVQPYEYFPLEAVMAAQYSYGDSNNLPVQAAGVLSKLLAVRPFTSGNLATALIAYLTFLNANGYVTTVSEAGLAEAIRTVAEGKKTALAVTQEIAVPAKTGLPNGYALRKLITQECNIHAEALALLAE